MVYSDAIEDKIDLIIPELKKRYPDLKNYRWHALKLLEGDKEITGKYPVDLPQILDSSYESDIIFSLLQWTTGLGILGTGNQLAFRCHDIRNGSGTGWRYSHFPGGRRYY